MLARARVCVCVCARACVCVIFFIIMYDCVVSLFKYALSYTKLAATTRWLTGYEVRHRQGQKMKRNEIR